MSKKGRPTLGKEPRSERVLICVESSLRTSLEDLAAESRRSLSDYCRYVLEHHVDAVQEDVDIVDAEIVEVAPEPPPAPVVDTKEEDKRPMPRCGTCRKDFVNCEC